MYELAKRYTKVVFNLAFLIFQQPREAFVKSLQYLNIREISTQRSAIVHMFRHSCPQAAHVLSMAYLCANHAAVTTPNCALIAPKCCGLSVTTTTAFCTVLRVTSAGRSINSLAGSCRVHDIPKRLVAAWEGVAERRSVK